MNWQKIFLFLGIFLLLVAFVPEVQAQCAMCRATVENNVTTGTTQIGAGLNKGILYLMVMPYLLFGVIFYFWRRNSLEQKRQKRLILEFGEVQN